LSADLYFYVVRPSFGEEWVIGDAPDYAVLRVHNRGASDADQVTVLVKPAGRDDEAKLTIPRFASAS